MKSRVLLCRAPDPAWRSRMDEKSATACCHCSPRDKALSALPQPKSWLWAHEILWKRFCLGGSGSLAVSEF